MATTAEVSNDGVEARSRAAMAVIRRPGRLDYIEGMRGIAAFYVVLQHICTMVDPHRLLLNPGSLPAWLGAVMRPLWYGHLAVSAFIVISGFCLQLSLFNRGDGSLTNPRRFLLRRCERILPPYYACLALSILVCVLVTSRQRGMPFEQYVPLTTGNVVSHLLMVHNLSLDWMYKINGVLWSIAIEFQLYFAFPFFVAALRRWGKSMLIGVLGIATTAIVLLVPGAPKMYVWYVPLFVLGMAMASLAFDGRTRLPSSRSLGLLAVLGASLTILGLSRGANLPVADSLGGLTIASLLLMGAAAPTSIFARLVGCRSLVKLGAFSYSLYLVHHPVMQIVFVYRPSFVTTPLRQFAYLGAIGVPLIVAICYGFFWVFERPFVKPRRSLSA